MSSVNVPLLCLINLMYGINQYLAASEHLILKPGKIVEKSLKIPKR